MSTGNGDMGLFDKQVYRVLIADDRLGNYASAGYIQYKLNSEQVKTDEEPGVSFVLECERNVARVEYRLKSEVFDLILLDLDFGKSYDCRACPGNKQYTCKVCEVIRKKLKGDGIELEDKDIQKELGAYYLKYIIRPFNPSIPAIIFTSKYTGNVSIASKYGLWGFNADYFEKVNLALFRRGDSTEDPVRVTFAFRALRRKLLENIRRFETEGYYDRIEVSQDRTEEVLRARSRDYMQTATWQALNKSLSEGAADREKKKFALAFLDFDGMKAVNDRLGQTDTNKVIKNFTELVHDYIEKSWPKFDSACVKPVLGRFFRERGDEFMILFPELSNKKDVQDFMNALRDEVNTYRWQSALFKVPIKERIKSARTIVDHLGTDFSSKTEKAEFSCQKSQSGHLELILSLAEPHDNEEKEEMIDLLLNSIDNKVTTDDNIRGRIRVEIEHHLKNYDQVTISKYLTSSFGLFVFPDDLSIVGRSAVKALMKPDYSEEDFNGTILNVFSEISRVPQLLKDNAKLLGKNQICCYDNRPGSDRVQRMKIGISFDCPDLDRHIKEESIKFLEYLTDDVTFDFANLNPISMGSDVPSGCDIHLLICSRAKCGKSLQQLQSPEIVWCMRGQQYDLPQESQQSCPWRQSSIIVRDTSTLFDAEKAQWLLTKYNKARHGDFLKSISQLKRARNSLFEAVDVLHRKTSNDLVNTFYPRFVMQEEIRTQWNVFFGWNDKFRIKDAQDVKLLMDNGKCLLQVGCASIPNVDEQEKFLYLLQGILQSNLDSAMISELADLKYEVTDPAYEKYRQGGKGAILYRNPLLSHLSPIVYRDIATIARLKVVAA